MAKKSGKIKWKDAGGNINYSADISENRIAVVGEMLLAVFCVFVLVCSARIMLSDVFECATTNGENLLMTIIVLILVGGIMEISNYTDVKWGRLIYLAVLIGGVISCIFYLTYKENGEHILSGLKKIGAVYGAEWNYYYNDIERVPITDIKYVSTALNFVTIILSCILMWIVKVSKKNIIAAVLPLTVFMAELLVGFAPKIISITLMFVGIVFSSISRWRKVDFSKAPGRRKVTVGKIHGFSWIITCIFTTLLCIIINASGKAFAWETVHNSEAIVESLNEFVEGIPDWSIWQLFLGYSDEKTAELTNDSPEYEDIEVLQMKTDKLPSEDIYLRGFYADTYDDGEWERELDAFEKACKAAGFNADEISEKIVTMGADKIRKRYAYSTREEVELIYLEPAATRAYASYFSAISDKDIGTEGDGRYIKDRGLDKYSYTTWLSSIKYEKLLNIDEISMHEESWEQWYDNYVMEQYLDVPEGMSNVLEIANEIMKESLHRNYFAGSKGSELNDKRLYVAEKVAEWMEYNTTYSLELPKLPRGEDPIEYFLGTSRTGYCMHYASAAAMILRQLGVPARYASGYLVPDESFKRTDELYESTIMDSQAHAWVEIYLTGIGWVPVEVTKGFYQTNFEPEDVQTSEQNQNVEINRPEENQSEEDRPEESQSQENNSEESQQHESGSENTGNSQENQTQQEGTENNILIGAGTEGNGSNGSSSGGSSSNGSSSNGSSSNGSSSTLLIGIGGGSGNTKIIYDISKIIVPTVVTILVIAIIAYIILRGRASYRNKLLNEIRRKRTLRAIRRINRRIYQKLRLTGKVLKTDLRDEGYEKLLVKNYKNVSLEEWKQYMNIVKAAAFSIREFSEEEMNFCHGVYRRVIRNS